MVIRGGRITLQDNNLMDLAALYLKGIINDLTLPMGVNKYLLWCTQSNKDSCL